MAINADQVKWADVSENDPITGAPNKVTPTQEFQNSGLKRNQPIPRAYLNYQFDKFHEFFSDIQEQIDQLTIDAGTGLLQQIFHVGAIYISASSTNPASRFGFGTWQRISGKFIVGYDSEQTEFNAEGKTGGSKTHSHTNTLSVQSAGSHAHTVGNSGWGSIQQSNHMPEPSTSGKLVTGSGRSEDSEQLESLAHATETKTTSTSGSHTHGLSGGINSASNLPPYEVKYIWERTA